MRLLSMSKGALVNGRYVSTFKAACDGDKTVTRRPGWVEWHLTDQGFGSEWRPFRALSEALALAILALQQNGKALDWEAAHLDFEREQVRVYWRPRLDVGDELQLIEWSPRVGPRWVCKACGWLGPSAMTIQDGTCPGCRGLEFKYRPPRRGAIVRVTEPLTRPPLCEMSLDEIRREGFGGWIPGALESAAAHCNPEIMAQKLLAERFAQLVLERKRLTPTLRETRLTRIAFEVVTGGEA